MEVNEPNAKYLVPVRERHSELGLLPDDWDVIELAARATIQSGIAKNANAILRDPVTVPYLRVANVQDGYLELREVSTIDIERSDLNRYAVLPGDVLMNEGGDLDKLGRGALWHGQISPCVHQNHVFVVRCKSGLVPEYLNAWTSTAQARRYFMLAGRQTTNLASINKTSLGDLTVAVPPTEHEQREIAKAIIDADALIDSLEQLLTKKRQIKQGAMQELLTGKRRLPEFTRPWQAARLEQLGIFLKGTGIKRDEALSGDLPCVRYGEIYTVHSDYIRCFHSLISPAVASSATLLRRGDLLFAGSGETKAEIGKCVAFVDDFPAYAGGDIVILRPLVEADSIFLGYLLNMPEVVRQKSSKGQGDAVVHISANALGEVEVALPRPSEQAAIAQVLSDMDAEITALEARLAKARALKQAMAQALLTGRIRLPAAS